MFSLKYLGGVERAPWGPRLGWARWECGGQWLICLGRVKRVGGDRLAYYRSPAEVSLLSLSLNKDSREKKGGGAALNGDLKSAIVLAAVY